MCALKIGGRLLCETEGGIDSIVLPAVSSSIGRFSIEMEELLGVAATFEPGGTFAGTAAPPGTAILREDRSCICGPEGRAAIQPKMARLAASGVCPMVDWKKVRLPGEDTGYLFEDANTRFTGCKLVREVGITKAGGDGVVGRGCGNDTRRSKT